MNSLLYIREKLAGETKTFFFALNNEKLIEENAEYRKIFFYRSMYDNKTFFLSIRMTTSALFELIVKLMTGTILHIYEELAHCE